MRRSKAQSGSRKTRRAPLMMALEPRVMFDGAAAPTAHALHPEHHVGEAASGMAAPRVAAAPAGFDIDHLRQVTAPREAADGRAAIEPARTTDSGRPTSEPMRSSGESARFSDGPSRLTTGPLRAAAASPSGPAVVFVDSRVADPGSLLQGVTPGTEIVMLKANSGGLQQIETYLSHHHEVGSVEIIAHGDAGDLLLGSTDVTAANVNSFAHTLGEIGANLRAGADILVYACNTAATARGVAFVDALARDTGHVVAASSNVTGAGGDWNLEIATGKVTALPVLSKSSEAHYAYALGTSTVTTAAGLNQALATDDLDLTGNDTITLGANITYASAADAATITHLGTGTLTINGAGHTINAAYLSRVLTVTAGNVVLENVTLEHGLLAGAGGALSLNGVSELGAGIYNSGTLTLMNVNVTQNVATGGGGGGTGVVGAGGGGGSGAGGVGGAVGGGLGTLGSGSSGGKGSGTGGGLGGTSAGGGAGGAPTAGGSPGGAGATTASNGLTVGGGGGGAGYIAGNGAAGGSAAGGIYNAGTGKLYVLGGTTITNNLGAAGGGGGGIGANVVNLVTVPFHGGVGGQGVGGIWNATTGQVYITSSAYAAMTGNVGASGTIGSATGGGSNAGYASPAAAAKINNSGTVVKTYVPMTPVVSSITTVGSNPNNAASETFTVNFSEAVSGVNALDFSLANTGTVAGVITSVTGSGSTYTVVVGPVTGDGTMALNFNPTTPVYDATGNVVSGSYTVGQTYTIEHTPPVAAITSTAANPNSLATDTFTATFSEAVGGVDAADFTVAKTGTVGAAVTSVTPINPDGNGRATSYTVTVGGSGGVGSVTGDGTLQLNLNATGTGITDAAGNAILTGALGPVLAVEHTAPVVTSINTVGSSPNNAASDAYTVTFSEAVSTPLATDFTLTNTGTAGGTITSILPVTSSGGNGFYSSYTVLVSPAFGDGTMRLNFVPLPSPIDAAGNTVAGSFTSGQSYTVEHTPPIATSIATAGANPNHAGSDTYTVTFSENVGGVDAGDFSLATTGTVAGAITSVTAVNPDANGRASTYTVTVGNVTGNGTLQVNLNTTGTGIIDAAGNALAVGTLGQVYVVEQTPPVATGITGPAANPNNLATDTFTVNFSEAVGGVAANDFTLLTSGTVGAGITAVTAVNPDSSGRASSYMVTVGGAGGVGSVTGNGTLELNLNATGTGITDAAGNAIIGGAVGPVNGIEHSAPVVTSINTAGSSTNNASSEAFVVTFSEPVTTPLSTDFTLTNTGTSAGIITSILPVTSTAGTGGYSSYTVLVSPATGDGTMRLDFAPTPPPIDAAGNTVAGSFTTGQVYTIEHTPPVATSIVAATGDAPNAASEQFTVNFTEKVGGVDAGDFTLLKTGSAGGTISTVTPVNPDGNGRASAYTVTVAGVTGIGTLEVNLNASGTGITDAAGNAIVPGGSLGQIYGVTHALPAVTSIVLDDPATNNLTAEQYTVNFSENVTGVNAADFSLTNGGTAGGVITSVTGSGSSYIVTVSPVVGDGTMRLDLNAVTTIVDATGNTTAGGYTSGPSYTIEHTPPVATSIVTVGANPNDAPSDQYTVNFSEAVGGVDAGDFTVATTGTVGAGVTSVTAVNPDANGRATSYTVTVGGPGGVGSVTGNGTLQLNLNASGTGISDAAGNAIVGGELGQVFAVGHTQPVVTSIATVGATTNDEASDTFTVTFSEPVKGVAIGDFTVPTTGTAVGAITSLTPVNPDANGYASSYTVIVGPVAGDGTLGLNFVSPVAGQPVDAYGNVTSGTFTGGVYTVDHTPPAALSINATTGDSPGSASDQFTVTFSKPVTGVDTADFALVAAASGGGTLTGAITSVTPVNPVNGAASTYTVTVDGIHGAGTLEVNLNATGTGITDVAGNAIVGGALGTPYTVAVTAPSVTAITLVDAATNNLGTEQFTVNFSEAVGGVAAGDFVLSDTGGVTGTLGATSVTAVNADSNGRASSYTVTVDNVVGNGTMRLDLATTESGITDAGGQAVSGGYTGGAAYTINHTAPTASSIALVGPAANNATTEQFTVNFSEPVGGSAANGGLTTADFALSESVGVSGTIASVSAVNPDANGRANSYTVTVNNVVGNGTMRLDLSPSQADISDAAGNHLSGGYTGGPAYTINHTAPVVSSITLVDAATNNLSSEQFTVNFSEPVSGVDAADFALHDTGSVTGSVGAVAAVNAANGLASSYTVTVNNVTGNGTMRLDLSALESGITDAAGNAASGGYSGGTPYTIEHTPPTVTSVTAVSVGPSDSSTQVFTVDFSEGVTGVTAADFAAATTGSVGTGSITVTPTSPLSSSYTVTVNGVTGNGTLGLNVNASGTGITDAAGNAIVGGFNTGAAVTIDNTPPAVTSIALVNAATNNLGSEQFTVTFSKSVSGVTAGDFVLTDGGTVAGTIGTVTPVNPDIFGHASTYTVTVNNVTGDGTMRLDLAGTESGITDYAGNAASGGYTAGPSYTIEHTPPAVASIILADPATNNLGSEQFTVNFSESVGGVTAGDFTLGNGGSVGGSITSVTAVNPDTGGRASAYTVTVGNVTGDGTMKLNLAAGESGIADAAGNAVNGGYTAGPAYTIEHTAPVVSSVNLVDAATNNLSSEQFTVNFSEKVGGVTAGDFVLTDSSGLGGSIATVTAVNPDASGRASAYTVTVNAVTGDGTMRLDLNAAQSGITDAAGNAVSGGFTAGPAYTIEHTAPAVTSIALVGAATNNAGSEQFTVNFSQSVGGLTAGDFVLTNGGSVTGTIGAITAVNPGADGRASAYTVTVNNVTGDGTMRLDVSAAQSGVTDAAGNAAAGGFTAGPAYTIEHTAPVVASIGLVGSASNDNASEQFTVNFSQSVGGVNAGDFALVTGGSVAGSITSVTPVAPDADGRAAAYTVTVTGVSGAGTMRLDVANSTTGITDAAGNVLGTGYHTGPVYTLGSAVPAVESISVVGPVTSNAASEQFVVKFSEDVTGVGLGDFALTTTGTAAGTIAAVAGSGDTYTVTVNGVSGDGTLRLDLNGTGAGIADAANHPLQSGFTAGQVVTLEHTAPSVTAIAAVGSSPNNADTEHYTVTFSQDVTGVEAADFSLVKGGSVAGVISSVTGSGHTYTVTVADVTGDGTMRLDLNAGAGITDAAGNALAGGYAGQVITLEHTAPTVTSFTQVGANPNNAGTEQYTLTFSEDVSGVAIGDFTLLRTGSAAGTITAVTGSGNTYTVTVSDVTGDGTLQVALNAGAAGIADAAGNHLGGGTTGSGGASEPPTTVEHTPPAVQSIDTVGANPNGAGTEQFTVTFSEDVTGVAVGDFTLVATGTAAGRITAVTGSGSTYVVTVGDASGDGTLRLDLNASGTAIKDPAGNAITTGFTSGETFTLQHRAPVVESVSAPPSSTYTAGETVDFTVTFDEPVVVGSGGGQPRIAVNLDSGGTHYATYVAGSGTNTVTFQYTVGATDQSPGGVTLGRAIDLNGGTLTDAAGNAAVLTLANVASDKGVVIGGVTPQLPLPGSGDSADAGAGAGAGGGAAAGGGAGSAQAPAYLGFVDNGLYPDDDSSTGQGLVEPYELTPITLGSVAAPYEPGDIAIDQAVQPPLSVPTLLEPVNSSFTFSVPVGTFQFDPGAVVVVNAAMADGSPLPTWLHFDPSTGRFQGTAPAGWSEHLHLIVSARDQAGRDVMLPVEVQFAEPATPEPVPHPRHVPKTSRNHAAAHPGRESLASQFSRYGRHAREQELRALVHHG